MVTLQKTIPTKAISELKFICRLESFQEGPAFVKEGYWCQWGRGGGWRMGGLEVREGWPLITHSETGVSPGYSR